MFFSNRIYILDNIYDLFCLISFCYTLIITFHQQLKALSYAVCIYILYGAELLFLLLSKLKKDILFSIENIVHLS